MMIDDYYNAVFLIANALLLAIACFAIVRLDRRCRQIESFWSSPTGNAVADAEVRPGDEQLQLTQQLEQRVGQLQRTVKVMELNRHTGHESATTPVERSLPIENAVRMARLGASVDDLTRSCGLNIGEAKLMQKLHGQVQMAQAQG